MPSALSVSAIALAAVVTLASMPVVAETVAARAEKIAKARELLEENLVDYHGARLRNFRHTTSKFGEAFCGEINAPNRMGGMTGWKRSGIILAYTSSTGGPTKSGLSSVPGSSLSDELPYWSICHAGATGGITVDPTDVSAQLAPGVTPSTAGGFS